MRAVVDLRRVNRRSKGLASASYRDLHEKFSGASVRMHVGVWVYGMTSWVTGKIRLAPHAARKPSSRGRVSCSPMASCRSTPRWAGRTSIWRNRFSASSSVERWTGSIPRRLKRSSTGWRRQHAAGIELQPPLSGVVRDGHAEIAPVNAITPSEDQVPAPADHCHARWRREATVMTNTSDPLELLVLARPPRERCPQTYKSALPVRQPTDVSTFGYTPVLERRELLTRSLRDGGRDPW
jgi:hypothetical protein